MTKPHRRATRVVLADQRSLMREALRYAIDSHERLEVVGEAASGCEAALVTQATGADVVLVTDDLPRCDGIQPTVRIRHDVEDCLVVVLAEQEDVGALIDALEAGASGYVTRQQPVEELVDVLHAVGRGETVVPPAMLGPILRVLIARRRQETESMLLLDSLTRREREVLALLGEGLNHRQIAERLFISAETVRTHIKNLLHKLDIHTRLEASALARACGLVEEAPVGL